MENDNNLKDISVEENYEEETRFMKCNYKEIGLAYKIITAEFEEIRNKIKR